MTRDTTVFHIRYSFHIETMHATLYNRLDKLLTFAQILLGSTIFATMGNLAFLGALVTVMAIISFVWQPGKAAMLYEIQAKKMKELITKPDTLSDSELHSAYTKAEETDNPTLGLLRDAAYNRALIVSGRESELVKLSLPEKVAAWFAGDLPKP
ncbi:Uncharacterised protein [Serratia fonticola]|uniref:hypothetical protein n=1 Tax=Serratia fonticola TaxID=47917 RepID=UPI002177FE1D|nr:hypothetical protein [Serratia fonticola]CAI0891940.1 Uncharacterised protein [Serratia fonticola]